MLGFLRSGCGQDSFPEVSLPGWQMAIFNSLCLHMVVPLCIYVLISPFLKDIRHHGSGLTLMASSLPSLIFQSPFLQTQCCSKMLGVRTPACDFGGVVGGGETQFNTQ